MTSSHDAPKRVRVFAPAKVNLGLAVTGRLEDGYHALDTLFVTLGVGDTLTLEQSDTGSIRLEIPGSDLPTDRENLVYRAAAAYLRAAGVSSGVSITLEKRLPIAAGLGGGSSDAAACLRGLATMFPSNVNLPGIAKSLGADVPFFLEGGARRARGIGERLEPVAMPEVHLVLANPGVGITAREAYQGLRGRFGPPLDVPAIIAALEAGDVPPYRNDLETPVLERYPVIADVKRALENAGLRGALMSGSGSTCFGLARSVEDARNCAERLARARPDWWIKPARTKPLEDITVLDDVL